MLKVSDRTIYSWRNLEDHPFPPPKVMGSTYRYKLSEIEDWIENQQ